MENNTAKIKCPNCGSSNVEPLIANRDDKWDDVFLESIDDAGGNSLWGCSDCGHVFNIENNTI